MAKVVVDAPSQAQRTTARPPLPVSMAKREVTTPAHLLSLPWIT